MKKLLITLLKIVISASIIGYLVYDAVQGKGRNNVFANLVAQPKQWHILVVAWAACATATFLTFVRWWYLVRALDVPCPFRSAIRISFWGYLFNLAPLGIVGGDLVKAVMLGHEHPLDRAKAVASVLIDRVIGLYVLFLVASAAILLTGFRQIGVPNIQRICDMMLLLTIVSTVGLGIMLGPDWAEGRLIRALGRIPRIGRSLESLIQAIRMYRNKPGVLLLSSAMSVSVHCLFAIGCYLIACGLPGNHLSLSQHFVVMPLSAATQVFPVPMGPFELVLKYFYETVPVAGEAIADGQGLVVALVYRLITLLIAALGIFYYFGNRREMAEVIHEAEEEELAECQA